MFMHNTQLRKNIHIKRILSDSRNSYNHAHAINYILIVFLVLEFLIHKL